GNWCMRDWDTMNSELLKQFPAARGPEKLPDRPFRHELPRPPAGLVLLPGAFPSCAVCGHPPARFARRAIAPSASVYALQATHASDRRYAIRLVPKNTSTRGLR